MGARKRATENDGYTEWHLRELARNTSSQHENQQNIMVFYSNKLRPPVAREEKQAVCRTPPARPFGEYLFYAEGVRYLHILSRYIFVSHEIVLWIYARYICISQRFIVADFCTSSHVFDLHVRNLYLHLTRYFVGTFVLHRSRIRLARFMSRDYLHYLYLAQTVGN